METDRLTRRRKASAEWIGPRSMCTCGHTGDGPSAHLSRGPEEGHGICQVPRCRCAQFTWANSLPAYAKAMDAVG